MGIKTSFEENPSQFSRGGVTPPSLPGSLPTSQLHAQGTTTPTVNPNASIHDLDGLTPSQYINNLPQ